jgi:fructose-1,6-bisphosphatase
MRCRHVLSEQIRLGPAATGDLTLLINAIEFTSKFIASNVRKARLINLFDPSLLISPPVVVLMM